ncbi:MAG: hypothetical protein FJ100_19855 [Deltaproteobacteria bacterium]|nr:hypothetical protein [Deltaproteobacteria bacterium]
MIPAFAYFDTPTAVPDRDAGLDLRLLAPLGRWPLRLVVLLALVPLLSVQWGAANLGLVAFCCAIQMLPSLALVGWGEALVRRSQAALRVANQEALARLHGTAAIAALAIGFLAGGVGWLAAEPVALWLVRVPGLGRAQADTLLHLEALQLVLWPALVTWTSLAEARLGESDRAAFRGTAVAVEAMAALAVAVFQWRPHAWPVAMSAAHVTLILLSVVVLWRERQAGMRPGFSWSEARELLRATEWPFAPEPGMMPVFFAALILPAAAGHTLDAAVPAAILTGAAGFSAAGWQIASRLEPVGLMGDLHADPYRARWRFGRSLDAATLVALGASIVLATYGGRLVQIWLGLPRATVVHLLPLSALLVLVAPVAVSAQWLRRADLRGYVAKVRGAELGIALPVAALLWSEYGWTGTLWGLVSVRALTCGLWLPVRACRHLGLSPAAVFGHQAWRLGLVALPSAATAVAFSTFKPPRTGREWTIQLMIVAILYVIPAFAAWSVMDTRRDRD